MIRRGAYVALAATGTVLLVAGGLCWLAADALSRDPAHPERRYRGPRG